MRLDIYAQFIFSAHHAQWRLVEGKTDSLASKMATDAIPLISSSNDLTSNELELHAAGKHASFAQPGRKIRRFDPAPAAA